MKRRMKILAVCFLSLAISYFVSRQLFFPGTPFLNTANIQAIPTFPYTFAYRIQKLYYVSQYNFGYWIARATNTAPPEWRAFEIDSATASRLSPEELARLRRGPDDKSLETSTTEHGYELLSQGYIQTTKGVYSKTDVAAKTVHIEITDEAKPKQEKQYINGQLVDVWIPR